MTPASNPLVSVIVPVYNVERYVDECLASIRAQTYANLEILVVEDCSTDGSLQALTPHLDDPRVRLIRHGKNGGLSAARNTGIEAATGEYVMFVDSDDLVDATLVACCVDCAQQMDAELVTYECTPFMDGAPISPPAPGGVAAEAEPIAAEYFRLPHFAWLKFIRRTLLRDPALRFPVGLYYEDWPFHWRLGLDTQRRVQLGASLYHYRQRATSITGSTGRKLLDLFAIHSRVIDMLDDANNAEAGRILAEKIRDSHWSVLTRIDAALLGEALAHARKADRALRSRGWRGERAWRARVMEALVRFPSPLALPALHMLRASLTALSASRRRPGGPAQEAFA